MLASITILAYHLRKSQAALWKKSAGSRVQIYKFHTTLGSQAYCILLDRLIAPVHFSLPLKEKWVNLYTVNLQLRQQVSSRHLICIYLSCLLFWGEIMRAKVWAFYLLLLLCWAAYHLQLLNLMKTQVNTLLIVSYVNVETTKRFHFLLNKLQMKENLGRTAPTVTGWDPARATVTGIASV